MNRFNDFDTITIDQDLIDSIKSDKGGFTRASLEALGLHYPLQQGWARRLIGTRVSRDAVAKAIASRNPVPRSQARAEPPPASTERYIQVGGEAVEAATDKQIEFLVRHLGAPLSVAQNMPKAFATRILSLQCELWEVQKRSRAGKQVHT